MREWLIRKLGGVTRDRYETKVEFLCDEILTCYAQLDKLIGRSDQMKTRLRQLQSRTPVIDEKGRFTKRRERTEQ